MLDTVEVAQVLVKARAKTDLQEREREVHTAPLPASANERPY